MWALGLAAGGVADHQPAAAPAAGRGGDGWSSWRAAATQPWADVVPALRRAGRADRGGPGAVPGRCSAAAYGRARCCSTCPRSRCPTGRRASRCSARSPASRCSPGCTTGCGWPTIVICVGAANALANPKRLLRSVPPALYEIGTALVVAVTVLPQFADSVRRVRAAQALRGGPSRPGRAACAGSWCRCSRTPSSGRCALAAGMDARGYGRVRRRPRPRSAARHRRADARRPVRDLRRRLRRARHAPRRGCSALPMLAARRGARRRPGWSAPAAGCSAPATAPTGGAGRSWRWPAPGSPPAVLGWWVGRPPARRSPTRRCAVVPAAAALAVAAGRRRRRWPACSPPPRRRHPRRGAAPPEEPPR